MRKAKKEKRILGPNSAHTEPQLKNFEKNSKKIQKIKKISFWHYSKPKRDEIGRKWEKKISVPNSVHTRPRQENSLKNSKKIHKN